MADIHVNAWKRFMKQLPSVATNIVGIKCIVDTNASVLEQDGKRNVTADECIMRGLTYACTVLAKNKTIVQIPIVLDDGSYIVKGQRKVIMLRKKRAQVPIQLGQYIATWGGKLKCDTKEFMPSSMQEFIPIHKANKVNVDPDMLEYMCNRGHDIAFDANHVNNVRIMTPDILLTLLVTNVLTQHKLSNERKGLPWKDYVVTAQIFSSMATGNWKGTPWTGVTQNVNTNNMTGQQAQLSTVVCTSTSNAARFVHPSSAGFFCVSDTPEGQKVGLVHTLLKGVHITQNTQEPTLKAGTKVVFVNGTYHANADIEHAHGAHIIQRGNELWAWTDAGRMYRHQFNPKRDILGHVPMNMPFATHNQAPRISFYCNMAKQAMTSKVPNLAPVCHTLLYAQKPALLPAHEQNAGCNVILAINAMGFNQEDSIVVAQGALDRGLFRSMEYKTYSMPLGTQITDDTIDADGIACEGTQKKVGDVLVATDAGKAKVLPRSAPCVTVDRAYKMPEENKALVRTAAMRTPVVGDKFTSRYAQKGTISLVIPDEDMPFTKDGIRPDVVINPHAFPSRMTVGQIMEMAGAKINVIHAKQTVDGTPWNETHTMEQLMQELHQAGQTMSGKERMYSGTTGLMLPEPIFIAPCWYQRLTHLATEKCYSRGATGPVDIITRQPTNGRKKMGGMRLGEMEKDVLLGHGAAHVLQARAQSIGTDTYNGVNMPHATALLMRELNSMLVKVDVDVLE